MTRILDVTLSTMGLIVCTPIFIALFGLCWLDTRAPIFRQERVGRSQKPFVLLKFRTMRLGTASVATHLVDASAVTNLGRLLRWTKADELPQLWNVLRGDMSLVGPRPCLPNQKDLIAARSARGVFDARPGITGLAQVTGIDMANPELLAEIDAQMLKNLDVQAYLTYLLKTLAGALQVGRK